jgi:2-polyprenyl-3-methyl-5-hydroxy-6-metoxy-1,4-benzoquinol methylase
LAFAEATGVSRDRIVSLLSDYIAEVGIGISTLQGVDVHGKRLLEIGSGLGLLSITLQQAGCDITALEPGTNGFDDNARLGAAVRSWLGAENLPMLDIEVAPLDPQLHGRFEVIFSVNVLEHIPNLPEAIAAMERVLADGGVMVHMCPNYAVPYEPHFGILLAPGFPRFTAKLAPRLVDHPVWQSLNFVTLSQIRRMMQEAGLDTTFRGGMLHQTFVRLDQDAAFGARHKGMITKVQRILKWTGLLDLMRHIPASLATPMVFECRRQRSRCSP